VDFGHHTGNHGGVFTMQTKLSNIDRQQKANGAGHQLAKAINQAGTKQHASTTYQRQR